MCYITLKKELSSCYILPSVKLKSDFVSPLIGKPMLKKKSSVGLFPLKKNMYMQYWPIVSLLINQLAKKNFFFFFVFGQMYSMSPHDRKAKDQITMCRQFFLFFLIMSIYYRWNLQSQLSIVSLNLKMTY